MHTESFLLTAFLLSLAGNFIALICGIGKTRRKPVVIVSMSQNSMSTDGFAFFERALKADTSRSYVIQRHAPDSHGATMQVIE